MEINLIIGDNTLLIESWRCHYVNQQRYRLAKGGTVRANLTWWQRRLLVLLSWLMSAYIWLVRLTCRIEIVQGQEHLDEALEQGVFIPCGWHQSLLVSGIFLVKQQRRGTRVGFLISPSREGEFIARVADAHGTEVMRGSSNRTGRQAIVAMRRGLKNGISPMIFADGPTGPAGECKPGAVALSSLAQTPILPIGCGVDRCWTLNTWDQTRIPKPFARFKIALGPLRTNESGRDSETINNMSTELAQELNALSTIAHEAAR